MKTQSKFTVVSHSVLQVALTQKDSGATDNFIFERDKSRPPDMLTNF
jgi:hypothetical protein